MDSMEKLLVATDISCNPPLLVAGKNTVVMVARPIQVIGNSSDDSSEEDVSVPELALSTTQFIKKKRKIQEKVQARIEELK